MFRRYYQSPEILVYRPARLQRHPWDKRISVTVTRWLYTVSLYAGILHV